MGVLALTLVAFLVPIALIDARTRRIPNRLTASAALLGAALVAVLDPGGAPERALSAALAGGAFLALALACPHGMGMGDAKLVAVLGLYLGSGVVLAVAVALLAGAGAGVAIVARRGWAAGRRATIAFGPLLAGGALVALAR